jgi:hypothetical protein
VRYLHLGRLFCKPLLAPGECHLPMLLGFDGIITHDHVKRTSGGLMGIKKLKVD